MLTISTITLTALAGLSSSAFGATIARLEVVSDLGDATRTLTVASDGSVKGLDGGVVVNLGPALLARLEVQVGSIHPATLTDLTPNQTPCPAHQATRYIAVTAAGDVEIARRDFNCHQLLSAGPDAAVAASLRDTLDAFLRLDTGSQM